MASTYESIFSSLHALVGNTPLMELRCRIGDDERTVYAKYEVPNFTGSIKDRMALYILEEAWRTGRLAPGGEIVEATSGNTGIAFAALGRALHHPVRIYMPDWMSRERVRSWPFRGCSSLATACSASPSSSSACRMCSSATWPTDGLPWASCFPRR